MMDLEFYEEVDDHIEWDGFDYYIQHSGDPDHFNGDPEMREAFLAARYALNHFEMLLDRRIKEASMGVVTSDLNDEIEVS